MSEEFPKIRRKQFEYGTVATGIYRGLLWVALVIPLYSVEWFMWYLAIMAFLGLGLRPLLERTGLYHWAVHWRVVTENRINRDFDERHVQQVERKMRDDRYRKRRNKHPDLPKNW